MARGASPGERRGGRQKGTPNKATVEREQKLSEARERILVTLAPEQIAAMSPLDIMLQAMQIEAQSGDWRAAAALAKEAAPYLHAKMSPKTDGGDSPDAPQQGYVVTPDQAESMEAWTQESKKILSVEKSGDPSQDLKPSS